MTSIVCENTTLSDAVTKAARIAPSKGVAFEKAAGVLLHVDPKSFLEADHVVITATDLDSSYRQRVRVLESEGSDDKHWRLPSALVANFLSSLPMSAGKTVKVSERDGLVYFVSGKARAKFRSIIDPMPAVEPFDPQGMTPVANFASRIDQVSWAVSSDKVPLTGIYVSGTELVAADGYQLVTMPCVVPVPNPIAVPLSKLGVLLRNLGDVHIRITDERIQIMPDVDTQMTCARYEAPYPNVKALLDRYQWTHRFTIGKAEMVDVLERMLVLVAGERYPKARLRFKDAVLVMRIELPAVGTVEDEVPFHYANAVAEQIAPRYEMWINPKTLLSAVAHASRESVVIATDLDPSHPIEVTDESGFRAVVMPTRAGE